MEKTARDKLSELKDALQSAKDNDGYPFPIGGLGSLPLRFTAWSDYTKEADLTRLSLNWLPLADKLKLNSCLRNLLDAAERFQRRSPDEVFESLLPYPRSRADRESELKKKYEKGKQDFYRACEDTSTLIENILARPPDQDHQDPPARPEWDKPGLPVRLNNLYLALGPAPRPACDIENIIGEQPARIYNHYKKSRKWKDWVNKFITRDKQGRYFRKQ